MLDGGREVSVGGSRERMLLIRLLLSANRVVSQEVLAEDLWLGAPPEGAARSLWVYVSRLRKWLRQCGAAGVLVTRAPGYLVEIEPDALDAARFEALVERGREQAAGGYFATAASTLRQALDLWRGPALAEVADAPFAQAEAARLEEQRLAALEARIEADLACGRHHQLVAELEALTRAHPTRERLWGQRMTALYRAGRQADALAVYQQLRRTLGEELGLQPSSSLRQLEGAILRQELELEWSPAAAAPEAREATEGVATVLFTDLVGSTELLARLGDDAAEELRRTHFALLRQAVAGTGGQEVKSLGDGLMVTFASPVAALRCAVAIQQAIAEHNTAHPEKGLSVRVGLHAGEPVRAEEDFFGTPVVVARRLCDQAPGGRILASELVRELVGSRGGFRFHRRGRLSLKGLPDLVAAVEVDWQPEGGPPAPGEPPPPIPLPGLLAEMGRVFVGREAEIGRLQAAWKEVVSGGRRVVLIGGEPGVGKTRLAAAFALEVHGQDAVVLAGRCDEDLGVSYQPFVEALRHLADHTPDAYLVTRLGRFPGELVRLMPELARRIPDQPPPPGSDPETERYRLFDAVAACLSATTSADPVLLVLDDLQWAAKPTLLLLRHVLRSPMRLLVVGTYRDSELGSAHPLSTLLADLRRDGTVERLALSGLDESAVLAVMERAAGHHLDEQERRVARAVHQETEGNPFFVWEVLRHLAESGAIMRRDGRWVSERPVAELGIPEGIRDVVGRRLSRLSETTTRMLAAGAVAGTEFDLPVIRAAADFGEEHLLSALEEATGARLLAEVPGSATRYRFAHALVRATLYEELSAARRTVLHRRVAEAIESIHGRRLDDHLPALAHHWARAASAGKAVTYNKRAGDRALAQLAHDEAVAYYRQALELLDASEGAETTGQTDPGLRCDLQIALGEALRRAGDDRYRAVLREAAAGAQTLGDGNRLAQIVLVLSPGSFMGAMGARDEEVVALAEQALAGLGDEESALRARLMAALAVELTFSTDVGQRPVHLIEEAIAIARRIGDRPTLVRALAGSLYALNDPDRLEERLVKADELVSLGTEHGDPEAAYWGHMHRYDARIEAGEVEAASDDLESMDRLAGHLHQPLFTWRVALRRAVRAQVAGRLAEAEKLALGTADIGRRGGLHPSYVEGVLGMQLVAVRYDQGRLGELEPTISEQLASQPGLSSVWRAMLALLYCETGRLVEAKPHFDTLIENLDGLPRSNRAWLGGMVYLATVAAALGDAAASHLVYEKLAPYPGRTGGGGGPSGFGAVDGALGLLTTTLGRFNDANRHFVAAQQLCQRIVAPTWLARTRCQWAHMLTRRAGPGDVERAEQLARQSLVVAEDLGMARVAEQARDVLAGA